MHEENVKELTWELVIHPWGASSAEEIRGELTMEMNDKIVPLINDYIKKEYVAAKRLRKG